MYTIYYTESHAKRSQQQLIQIALKEKKTMTFDNKVWRKYCNFGIIWLIIETKKYYNITKLIRIYKHIKTLETYKNIKILETYKNIRNLTMKIKKY